MQISRRRLLGAAAATTATLMTTGVPRALADTGRVQTFGIANPGASLDGFIRSGDLGYLVTRGATPTLLAEFDLTTREVSRYVEVPSGLGAWAMTASSGYIFIGMYDDGSVHRYDPAAGTIVTVGRLGQGTYVWDMSTAPDGKVFAVTYPDGKVWEIDPITTEVRDLGAPVPGAAYGRYVAADDTTVFAAINTPGGHVMAIDRATGEYREITPQRTGTDVPYGPLRLSDGRLYINGGGYLIDMLPDGSDARFLARPGDQRSTDHISPQPDGTVYLSTVPSGNVYRYRYGDTELTEVATPVPGDSTRCISQLDATTLFGATLGGVVWYLDLPTGSVEAIDLIDAGMPVSALRPQSVAVDAPPAGDTTVFVAGTNQVQIHRPWDGDVRRVRVEGEPKAMLTLNGMAYGAIYPSTQLVEINPVTATVRSLGHIGNEQYRPGEIAYDRPTRLIAVASGASFGKYTGALTLLDPRTGKIEVHRELLANQALRSVAVDEGIAYVVGDVRDDGGAPGIVQTASVAAFDLRRRKVLWRTDPVVGYESMWSIGVLDGVAYVVLSRPDGAWFALDLSTRTVLQAGTLSGHGRVVVHRGQVFATVYGGGNIYHLGPGLSTPKVLVGGLKDLWFGGPDLAVEATTWYGWGQSAGSLARIDLQIR